MKPAVHPDSLIRARSTACLRPLAGWLSSTQQLACAFRSIHLTSSSLCSLYWLQVASGWDKDQNTARSAPNPSHPRLSHSLWYRSQVHPAVPTACPHTSCVLCPGTPSHPHSPLPGLSPSRSIFPTKHSPYSVNHPVTAFNVSIAFYLFI